MVIVSSDLCSPTVTCMYMYCTVYHSSTVFLAFVEVLFCYHSWPFFRVARVLPTYHHHTHTHTHTHTPHTHTHTHTQLAIKAMPYHADLVVILGSDGSDESLKQVIQDIGVYAQNVGEICVILDEFLVHRNVETES